jgi:DNA recombination protein RmuC
MNPILLLVLVALAAVAAVIAALLAWSQGRRADALSAQLAALARDGGKLEAALREEAGRSRQEAATDARAGRQESAETLARFGESLVGRLKELTGANAQLVTELRDSVQARLKEMQADNATKLEEMRKTVDEKLHATLEARLGESFKQVSERLEQVHRGLGEMATLATGVGDLKRVLTNVKSRGGWGEVQLEAVLEQLLTPEQFGRNVKTRPGSDALVDFAIRLPGRVDHGEPVWLPLDAKFPREDYERLIDASERGDVTAVEAAGKALEIAVKTQARSIHDKYVEPPYTTDFALMFLPTEGLYAEVLRRPGLSDSLQRDFRVTIAGPTTLTALLNSLQMGFKTLAIEKRSSDVWKVLGTVKTEFGKFGDVLKKVGEKLEQAQKQLETTGVRTRAIQRQLSGVESLPVSGAASEIADFIDDEPEAPLSALPPTE